MFDHTQYAAAIEDARQHALEEWPRECCGFIGTDSRYHRMQNVSSSPEDSFNCHQERLPHFLRGRIVAMLHSHPYPQETLYVSDYPQDFGPSEHDMKQQLADQLPWGIIATNGKITMYPVFWGDDIPPVDLLGRQFRHGPTGTDGRGDCYALIKDTYSQKYGITLPEGPRSPNWWHNKQNLYIQNMERAGFKPIKKEEAREGDVFFAQVNASVPNHGGVLLNGGLVLHHLYNRTSRVEPLLGWRKHIVRWIRHAKRS
jgi:proteasome lid subunit RPN8/RPN11